LVGTELTPNTIYHLQNDGKTKIVNKWVEGYLRNYVSGQHKAWVRFGFVTPLHKLTIKLLIVPLHGSGVPIQARAPINHHVSWAGMPHPWAHAPCLVFFLMLIVMTPHGRHDGVVQPLWCTHVVKGRQVHSLGMLSRFPTLAKT
jgi:hypothetical protein